MPVTTVPLLSGVDPFPERKLPQTRFDSMVHTSFNQLNTFTKEMNEEVIPALNSLTTEIQTSTNGVRASELSAEASANRAAASEQRVTSAFEEFSENMTATMQEVTDGWSAFQLFVSARLAEMAATIIMQSARIRN